MPRSKKDQAAESDELHSKLREYVFVTEVPILAEFCAESNMYEEFILKLAQDDMMLLLIIKILENKKRAALERKIYAQELNATIGAHLLKTWREAVQPEAPAKLRVASLIELDELGLSDQEIKIYCDVQRKLDLRGGEKDA